MAGPRYVEIPSDRLLGELRAIGAAVAGKGGGFREGTQGWEVVFDVIPPGGRAVVRVYTSLTAGADVARDCGEDAVRIAVVAPTPEGPRALTEARKMLRTAPAKGDRVGTFLGRLRAAIREAYVVAARVPLCPDCGRPMAVRDGSRGKFYGCIGYPSCRRTRPLEGG